MKYIEYGKHCLDTIILLHGGGLSWWNYEDVANALQNERLIVSVNGKTLKSIDN